MLAAFFVEVPKDQAEHHGMHRHSGAGLRGIKRGNIGHNGALYHRYNMLQ